MIFRVWLWRALLGLAETSPTRLSRLGTETLHLPEELVPGIGAVLACSDRTKEHQLYPRTVADITNIANSSVKKVTRETSSVIKVSV